MKKLLLVGLPLSLTFLSYGMTSSWYENWRKSRAFQDLQLECAAFTTGILQQAQRALVSGANVNFQNSGGWAPLHGAAYKGHTTIVEFLLANGANVNIQDGEAITPLHWAIQEGHTATVKILLDAGANINAQDKYYGFTPLHVAVLNGYVEIAKILLDAGADRALKDKEDRTALDLAQLYNKQETVTLLD
jgi:ankyrin repeat protein